MTPWSTLPFAPRKWQAEALPVAIAGAHNGGRGIISAVMGSGKSILIAELCRHLLEGLEDAYKIVVTTPSIRLVRQLMETIAKHGLNVSGYFTHEKSLAGQVIVACIPSTGRLAEVLAESGQKCAVWIADEAHKSNAAEMRTAIESLAPFSTIGFSATPFCAEERKRLVHFDHVLHEYDAQQAMQDGVIVPPELVHYGGTSTSTDQACLEMIKDVLGWGPGIVNAANVADAEAYATYLSDHGVRALPIHSYMTDDAQADAVDALEAGTVDCLVHVRLLTEGVDFPWLRWLCLRRVVSSRVAFCQEVGRVLRSHAGKRRAFVLDPHDLFNDFGLSYDAMLGCQPEPAEESLDKQAEQLELELGGCDPGEDTPLILLDRLSSYLRKTALRFYSSGYAKRQIKSRGWRRDWPSDKQLDMLKRANTYSVMAPDADQVFLDAALQVADELTKGDVSDLITILLTAKRLHRWPLSRLTEES